MRIACLMSNRCYSCITTAQIRVSAPTRHPRVSHPSRIICSIHVCNPSKPKVPVQLLVLGSKSISRADIYPATGPLRCQTSRMPRSPRRCELVPGWV
ncbi:unnamed protein product [Mycena citricolor]|uniref:Uncharacterized protein n=1 Tax=Mycena citricolor TaxID=2018698 RepID=A0AAD2HAU4_9AGAR|nr:unnamed protein product [Mycena citricolor]